MTTCYCGSGQEFSSCCQPLLLGEQHAVTAEQLMRSRFSAYCTQAIDYIVQTYHASQRSATATVEITSFAQAAYFLDLQVHSCSAITPLPRQGLDGLLPLRDAARPMTEPERAQDLPADSSAVATVSFSARFILQDKLQQLTELSRFVYCTGRWFYLDGELSPTPVQKISRNDACPCGSGKKYKVCQHR
jgi:SEC-C motif-containing protein